MSMLTLLLDAPELIPEAEEAPREMPDLSRFFDLIDAARAGQLPTLEEKDRIALCPSESTLEPGKAAISLWERMRGLWLHTITGDGWMKPRPSIRFDTIMPVPEWAYAQAEASFAKATAQLDVILEWWREKFNPACRLRVQE